MLESLCCHWHLHNKMLSNVLLTKFFKYVQSRVIFPAKLICYFHETQSPQCFLACVEHRSVIQLTLCHCRAKISFNSSQSWAGAFTNSIPSWSKQKKFEKNYDFWEQIFCGCVNSCSRLMTNDMSMLSLLRPSKSGPSSVSCVCRLWWFKSSP